MTLPPPLHPFRRHLVLLGAAVVLTQVPALPLLLLCGTPSRLATLAYGIGSIASTVGVVTLALAYWERFERIVGLVRGYAEEHRLPSGHGSLSEVEASLASLDGFVRSLEREAARDHLTGILNRRTCASRLESDLARALRSKTPFSVAIFDLDDLKAINDGHGHTAGDVALRHLADALQKATREGDWVARWGGDEFVLGLWDADGAQAATVAGRVFERLAAEVAAIGEGGTFIGTSAGVAQAIPGDDAARLFARADAALLEAKRGGRRRVVLASDDPQAT